MVIHFKYPHPVGSVCRHPCKFCRDTKDGEGYLNGHDGSRLPLVPLYIIRVATRDEYVQQCRDAGCLDHMCTDPDNYYLTSTD